MRIVKIMEDNNGFKLIAFQRVLDNKGFKPSYSTTSFADFYPETNCLRLFSGNGFTFEYLPSYRAALKKILSM